MTEYFEKEDYSPETIKEQKVIERIKTQFRTDPEIPFTVWSNGKEISPNKIKNIEYFDENGLCYLKVNPIYELMDNNQDFSKLSALERFFYQKKIEGNVPTGFYDSTYNYYDDKQRLVKVNEVKRNVYGQISYNMTQTYSFDENDNLILQCSEYSNSQSLCKYVIYNYDSNGIIKSSKDSFSVLMNDRRKNRNIENKYSYDLKNRISSIGNKHFVYDNNNLVIEEFVFSPNTKVDIIKKKFDKNKNQIQWEWIRAGVSEYDPKTGLTTVKNYDTSITYNKYNNLNLLIESSHKTNTSSDKYDLYKYEYKFK